MRHARTSTPAVEETDAIPEGPWLTRKQAAHYLTTRGCRISDQTLRHWASKNNEGKGPRFYRNGWSGVVYLESDLETWRRQRLRRVE